jgi:ATP-binding cassette subfamily F protein 3
VLDLSISVANQELLNRTTLHLVQSRHYVLVGRNGTGKSTLLEALSDGLIPGIPWTTKIMHLGQIQGMETEVNLEDSQWQSESVLQHVIKSDRTRERLLREARVLSQAFEETKDEWEPIRAYRRVQHERIALKLKEAHRIAERRSGARGKLARKELIELEGLFEKSAQSIREEEEPGDLAHLTREAEAATDMLRDIQASLELIDSSVAEPKARRVLLGLGFSQDSIEGPKSQLSGGWKTRCDLACALTQYADILLLDEPTNFLDLPSIIWLQGYIQNLKETTVLITTHDRDFGDAVAEELILLRNQKLETFRGNLSLYEWEQWKNIRYWTKMKDAKGKQQKHIEKSIENNIRAARNKGDDKKLKQAASRQKKLNERWGIEVGLKGGRFKLNRDLGGYHLSNRAEIEIPVFEPPVKLAFPRQPPKLKFPGALVSLENVSFAYRDGNKAPVLKDVSLTIHPGTRTGIAGLNGSGKTTLVSLIMGSSHEGGLATTTGIITQHPRAKFGWFSQSSVERISTTAMSDLQLTALRYLMQVGKVDMEEKDARQILGSLGLHGRTVSDVPLALLSGGQKARVELAKLLWRPPQLLILDEVTTHLDADTILSLIHALKRYDGALLVITHDRFFMR